MAITHEHLPKLTASSVCGRVTQELSDALIDLSDGALRRKGITGKIAAVAIFRYANWKPNENGLLIRQTAEGQQGTGSQILSTQDRAARWDIQVDRGTYSGQMYDSRGTVYEADGRFVPNSLSLVTALELEELVMPYYQNGALLREVDFHGFDHTQTAQPVLLPNHLRSPAR